MASFLKSKRFFLVALISFALLAEFAILYYFFILVPRKEKIPIPVKPPPKYLIKLEEEEIPEFIFSPQEFEKLKMAFQREKEFLSKKITYEKTLPFGEKEIQASLIKESAELLLKTLKEAKTQNELNRLIKKRFIIYQATGREGEGKVLFTGYHSPLYEGSLKKYGPYRYPLYMKPDDLKVANLEEFDPSLKRERIVYRIDFSKGEIVPYWSREDIVKSKVLAGKNLEFVYLKDRLDRFYLMVEGSGKIILDNGETFWVRYAATNGRPYISLGQLLAEEGKIPRDKLSMQSIREYFSRHPEEMDKYLNQNETFVFFAKDDREDAGALGAAGCVLTPEVSIAVDKRIFPLGAPAYIEYPEPQIDDKGRVVDTRKVARFAFCQDTGGIIKGPGRVDIYFGEGEKALAKAGHMRGEGKLYFFIKK